MEEHIHTLTSLHTTKSISKVVKDIKVSSNEWMKKEDYSRISKNGKQDMEPLPYQSMIKMD